MTLSEAKQIVTRANLNFVKEATTYSGRSARFDINRKIIEYIGNDKFIIAFLMGMYGRQEADEKMGRYTIHKNLRGFNQTDAGLLSFYAEKIANGEKLTPKEMAQAKRTLMTYKNTQCLKVLQEIGYIQETKIRGQVAYIFNDDAFAEDPEAALPNPKQSEENFVNQCIALAEQDKGIIDDDDLDDAKALALDMYRLGVISPQDVADKINEEF
jgi:hypothetical protein